MSERIRAVALLSARPLLRNDYSDLVRLANESNGVSIDQLWTTVDHRTLYFKDPTPPTFGFLSHEKALEMADIETQRFREVGKNTFCLSAREQLMSLFDGESLARIYRCFGGLAVVGGSFSDVSEFSKAYDLSRRQPPTPPIMAEYIAAS